MADTRGERMHPAQSGGGRLSLRRLLSRGLLASAALAALVAQKKNADPALAALIGAVSVDEAAAASGLSVEQLQSVAENFASLDGLAVPGSASSGSTDLSAAVFHCCRVRFQLARAMSVFADSRVRGASSAVK